MPDTLIVRGTTRLPPLGAPVVATIGNFDGVHLGHQRLLGRVRGIKGCWAAEGSSPSAVAISFHPHPSVVLGRAKKMPLISSLRQRLAILSSFEIDIFYMLHFTKQFARVRAADFVERVLFGELNVQHLVVGPDATVGYRREGDVHFLARAFAAAGRSFETIPPLMIEDLRVSSEHIRSLLREGRVEEAARLLGRSFVLDSLVIQGDRRGSSLGFPTANLKRNEQLLPADGVYVTRTLLCGVQYGSVTSVGRRPTFEGMDRRVETHLLGYGGGDFYNERIEVEFLTRLRDELKFSGVDELRRQIEKDIEDARKILNGPR